MLMKAAHPKTNIRRTFLVKLYFDFMVNTLAIKLRFGQQVAVEAVKKISEMNFRCRISRNRASVPDALTMTEVGFFTQQEGPREWLRERQSHGCLHSGSNPNNSPVPQFSARPAQTRHPNRHRYRRRSSSRIP